MDWLFFLGVSARDSVYFSGDPNGVQAARNDLRAMLRQDPSLSQRVQIIDRDVSDDRKSWYEYAHRLADLGRNEGQIMVLLDPDYVDGTMPARLPACIYAHAHFGIDGRLSVVKQRAPVVNDDVLKLMLGRRL